MQRQTPHLDESTSASPALSPGPVQGQETLLRIIIDPDHITEGRIQPSAIQLRDLTHRGLSVHRREHATRQEVERVAQTMLGRTTAGGTRRLEGLTIFTSGAVRRIRYQERQAFVVIDTAQPENRAHASIYLATLQMKPSLAREMREQLLNLMTDRLTLEQAFAGE